VAGLGNLFRTTAFKLSLFYFAVFAVTIFLTLGYVAWNANRLVYAQMVSTIDAEITGLAEQFERGGPRRLVNVVNRRSRSPGASLYLITARDGRPIAGNVEALSSELLNRVGQHHIEYARVGDDDRPTRLHRAIVRIYHLPGGSRLLVGRDIEEQQRLSEIYLDVPVRKRTEYKDVRVSIRQCVYKVIRVYKRAGDACGEHPRVGRQVPCERVFDYLEERLVAVNRADFHFVQELYD
jgi:hypothetical protein